MEAKRKLIRNDSNTSLDKNSKDLKHQSKPTRL